MPLLAIVFCFGLLSLGRGQNLLDLQYGTGAGSFELGTFIPENEDNEMFLPLGSMSLTGWTIGGPGDGVVWIARGTSKFVDLAHLSASSVSTLFSTVPGYQYQLSFDYFEDRANEGNDRLWVYTGSTLLFNAGTPCCGSVRHSEVGFVANYDQTTLTFRSIGPWNNGPALDNVVVELVAVPEPSTFGLMLLGAAVTLGLRSVRKRRQCEDFQSFSL